MAGADSTHLPHLFAYNWVVDTDDVSVAVIHYKLHLEHDKLDTEVDDMKWDLKTAWRCVPLTLKF